MNHLRVVLDHSGVLPHVLRLSFRALSIGTLLLEERTGRPLHLSPVRRAGSVAILRVVVSAHI